MAIDLDAVGTSTDEVTVTWGPADVLLYNLAVGAGQRDPLAELDLTTENSDGVELRPIPSFVVSLVQANSPKPYLGEINPGDRLHGEQAYRLHEPLPVAGSALLRTRVEGMYDHRSGALVNIDSVLRDARTGRVLAETRMGSFIRGEGGFGGPRAPRTAWTEPSAPPDAEHEIDVRADQALIYRLCGDRNPLHSDPTFARDAGFDRPILHGLCTFGMACRVLSSVPGGSAPVTGMSARFVKPVIPGTRLRLRVWHGVGFQVGFRVLDEAGDLVLDRGTVSTTPGPDLQRWESDRERQR